MFESNNQSFAKIKDIKQMSIYCFVFILFQHSDGLKLCCFIRNDAIVSVIHALDYSNEFVLLFNFNTGFLIFLKGIFLTAFFCAYRFCII